METLLKPAKLLAEWDFNFSQNLERYFESLKNVQTVNFGEAALVLQNSANVYARRIENLWEDTESLGQSLVAQNEGEEKEGKPSKKKHKSKCVIDFNDFESLKLEDYISKSNNLKEGGQKSLKLLTRRFTQLESNLAQLSSPIEILDIQGEIIGNKYDFRCNQQLTKNCMLVDELQPMDFAEHLTTEIPEHETSSNSNLVLNQDSGFCSIFEHTELQAATPESINSDDMETANVDNFTAENFDQNLNIPNESEAHSIFSETEEDVVDPTISSTLTKPESELIKEKQILEPIPFEHGVPDPIPKRRTQFKLPCHISLLKTKTESRKRKTMSETKKRAYLTRCLLDNYELVHKKLKMYSSTKQLCQLKKEELEEFIDQYIKSMRDSKKCNFEAITSDATMELLGFQSHFTKNDLIAENLIYMTENNPVMNPMTIIEPESDLSSVPESFTTPPPTPEANSQQLNYRELVEQRMRQIGDETLEQSDLEQRVAEWHKSLRSKLAVAGRRPPFDIHEYSSEIIKTLEVAESNTIPFSNLVKNQSPPEIARYFLASLQLANSYDISMNSSTDSGRCIELALLEQGRRHEPP